MEQLFEDGLEDFVNYQKDQTNKKPRAIKKKEKLQKLKADLADPIQRKQRNLIRRQAQKNKLQKQLKGMTQEQANLYLDKRGQDKRKLKQRNLQALKTGMPILIDLVYQSLMNEKENKSLAIQIQLIMKVLKVVNIPPGIHLCGVGGFIKLQLQKMAYQHWTIAPHQEDITQVAKMLGKKLIYLSPDAQLPLQKIDQQCAYVIGGLVDRTVIKNASRNRAKDLQIESRHLPIRQFMKNRSCLNLDHVVMMLCKFKQTNNWKEAFDFSAPTRWQRQKRKQQNGKHESLKQESPNEEQDSLNEQKQTIQIIQ